MSELESTNLKFVDESIDGSGVGKEKKRGRGNDEPWGSQEEGEGGGGGERGLGPVRLSLGP